MWYCCFYSSRLNTSSTTEYLYSLRLLPDLRDIKIETVLYNAIKHKERKLYSVQVFIVPRGEIWFRVKGKNTKEKRVHLFVKNIKLYCAFWNKPVHFLKCQMLIYGSGLGAKSVPQTKFWATERVFPFIVYIKIFSRFFINLLQTTMFMQRSFTFLLFAMIQNSIC